MGNGRFIVTAGGTGGHIFPAIAIARGLIEAGSTVLYVGNRDSIEEKIVSAIVTDKQHGNKLTFTAINVQKLYRSITWKHLIFPFKLLGSIKKSISIIRDFQPDACIGTGGYVSAPVIIAAVLMGRPYFLQEQNSVPGLTTKLLSLKAQRIYCGYEEAKHHLSIRKTLISGNPVIVEHAIESRKETPTKSIGLLVLGGSQGAQTINKAINDFLPHLYSRFNKLTVNLVWQCGERNYAQIRKLIPETLSTAAKLSKNKIQLLTYDNDNKPNIEPHHNCNTLTLLPFTNNMSGLYHYADIAISRAGAISLAELDINKIPAIIIPITKSAGNHQYLNAKSQLNSGKGILIKEADLNSRSLLNAVIKISENYEDYSRALSTSCHSEATDRITTDLMQYLRNNVRQTLSNP